MTENELIASCKRGDRDAFNEIVMKYQTQVFNIAYSVLSDYDDASDAAQEVFIKIYRSIASFKGQSSFSTWLYRICVNVCNDILRKRQRRGPSVSLDAEEEDKGAAAELVSELPTPEQSAEQNERQRIVREAIAGLNEEYRAVIICYDIQQLSYEETAAILKCPVGTVKSRLNRARAALRKKLSENRELF